MYVCMVNWIGTELITDRDYLMSCTALRATLV